MGIEGLFVGTGLDALRTAVGQELPALLIVLEIGHHDLVEHLLMDGRDLDGHQRFDAAMKIAGHPVGRRDIDLRLWMRQCPAAGETYDAAVFEITADDALDANILRESLHAR